MSLLDALLGLKKIFANGVELTSRQELNFIGTAVDNPSTGRTDITLGGSALSVRQLYDAAYTLVLSDANSYLEALYGGGNMTFTVPPHAAVPFPVGTRVWFCLAIGGGALMSIAAGSGVTITVPSVGDYLSSPVRLDLYSEVQLTKVKNNEWRATGDLKKAA